MLTFALIAWAVFAGALACGSSSAWRGSVGAMLGKNHDTGRVYVREVPSDMPAARAGLRPGDEIVAIDGKPVLAMSPDEVHRALAGAVGSKVKLSVHREKADGGDVEIEVERGPLKAPSEAPPTTEEQDSSKPPRGPAP